MGLTPSSILRTPKEAAVARCLSQFFNTRRVGAASGRGSQKPLLTETAILSITLHPIFRGGGDMATVARASSRLASDIVDHLLVRLAQTPTCDEPYSHFYVENVFPAEVYADMMQNMPAPALYKPLSLTKHRNADGVSTRDVFALTGPEVEALSPRAPRAVEQRFGGPVGPRTESGRIPQTGRRSGAAVRLPPRRGRPHHRASPSPRCFATWKATRFRPIRMVGPRSSPCSSICRSTIRS